MALERQGIHTVTVVWDTFEKAARATARIKGMPDAAFVVTPSRRSDQGPEHQRAKAREAVAEIVRQLLAG